MKIKWKIIQEGVHAAVDPPNGVTLGWVYFEQIEWRAYTEDHVHLGDARSWQAARNIVQRHYDNLGTPRTRRDADRGRARYRPATQVGDCR